MNNKVLQAIVEIAGNVSPTLQKAVESTCEKLDKVNLKAVAIGAAAAAGAVAVAKGAIEAGKYLADLGSQFDGAVDSIRIGTGATGDALDALVDDFNAVYSSVPTSMDDASKAIADYNTRLGLTGEELQGVSKQAIQVADMLGEDLGGVIESSSKAFQQWQISAEDMGDNMDYVFKASQSTGVGFTELMQTVQSFGPQLHELGFSFEEATALVGQLEKAGVNTSEVLGSMKKSVSAMAKEGLGAAEGLDKYANAILNAKDMTEATTIASEVFGSRAASTMAAALRDGTISVDELTASLVENGETIAGCAADTYDYAEQMQLFKQKAEVALEPLAATMFNSLNELMPVVGDLMTALIPVIQTLATTLTPLIEEVVAEIGPMLSEFVPPIAEMAASIAQKLIPPLLQIIGSVLPVIIQLAGMLLPIVDLIVADLLPALVIVIQKLLPPIMNIVEKLLPVVTELLEMLIPLVVQIIDAILPVVIQLLDALMPILDVLLAALMPILDVIIKLLGPIIDIIMLAIKPLIAIISTLISVALRPLMPIIELVAGLFTGVLGSAISSIQPVISALQGVFSGLISFIQNVFAGNWSGAWNSVINIFSSIWAGMKAIFTAPVNFIIDGINKFISGLNKLKIPDWVPEVGGKGLNIPLIPKLATGGFTEGISIAGEAGMEAVISFDPAYHDENVGYWKQAGELLGVFDDIEHNSGANDTPQITQAGKLMALENFSLGQLTETTIIYYDFSGLSYAPQVDAGTDADKEDIIAALKHQASEFFDWLEEWIRSKEVGNFDRVSIY